LTSRHDWHPSQSDLERLVAARDIDTVIVAFCDMQGRLTASGCRRDCSSRTSPSTVRSVCNYLLAVDVDMNTVDGYAISSWRPATATW